MIRWWKLFNLTVGGLGAVASIAMTRSAAAQDGALTELYGYGVHRFHAGDYAEADRVFDIVIDAGVDDPRALYFRGLTQYQLGLSEEAKADFERGAEMEARGGRVVNVSFALQRIQGPQRQIIEMSRMMARVAVAQELRNVRRQSGDQSRTAPNVVAPPAGIAFPPSLSDDVPVVPVTPAAPPAIVPDATAPVTPLPDTQVDPFRDDAPAAMPPVATPPAATPPAATPPAVDDPFSTAPPAASPATAIPEATPAAPNDPFSTPPAATPASPVLDDPFSTDPTPAVPAAPSTP